MIHPTPILNLRLLNENLPTRASIRMDQLVKAKDLLRRYPQACHQEDIDIELFHNDQIRYSGIQLDQYQHITDWTAVGTPAVKALILWYQLAQHEALIDCSNVVESTEFYTPRFLEQARQYRINNFILSKNIQKEFAYTKNPKQRKVRLEKYLFGNLMTFFNHIGFSYDKNQYFLKVELQHYQMLKTNTQVFHQQQKQAYQVDFSLNFQLPQTLRLGQSTALGYGRVTSFFEKK